MITTTTSSFQSNARKTCPTSASVCSWGTCRRAQHHVASQGYAGQCGDLQGASDINLLQRNRITHILTMGRDRPASHFSSMIKYKEVAAARTRLVVEPARFRTLQVEIMDCPAELVISYFKECFEFIDAALKQKGNVFIHCGRYGNCFRTIFVSLTTNDASAAHVIVAFAAAATVWLRGTMHFILARGSRRCPLMRAMACSGISRSSAVVIGYLMYKNKWTFAEVLPEIALAPSSSSSAIFAILCIALPRHSRAVTPCRVPIPPYWRSFRFLAAVILRAPVLRRPSNIRRRNGHASSPTLGFSCSCRHALSAIISTLRCEYRYP